jgi:hypothetical protein
VFVALDATRIDYGAVADPMTQLRFHDMASDTDCPFEIDHWNPAGQSGVWVNVPTLHAGATEHVLMYFGPTAGGTANPAQTWTNGYQLVQHFEPSLLDSTGNYGAGTLAGATLGPGTIGSAALFTGGSNQTIAFGNDGALLDGWGTFVIELWIYADYTNVTGLGGEPHVLEKGGSVALPRLINAGGAIALQLDMHFTGAIDLFPNTAIPPRKWTYVAFTSDNQTLRVYNNGVMVASQSTGGHNLINATSAFLLGSTGTVFTGALDEVRLETVGHSGNWILAQYLAMSGQSVSVSTPP